MMAPRCDVLDELDPLELDAGEVLIAPAAGAAVVLK